MNKTNTQKKPFGLVVAVKVALEAIRENVAPISVVLSNLFGLQKSTSFPKELTKEYFSVAKYQPTDAEKKVLGQLMESFRRPGVEPQDFLEKALINDWVKKVAPPIDKSKQKSLSNKPFVKKKNSKQKIEKKEVTPPTIIVKKTRLGS